jgi:hypothetical protein
MAGSLPDREDGEHADSVIGIPQPGEGSTLRGVSMIQPMDANDTFHRHVEVDDRFLADWIAFGISEMNAYLAKHLRFARYCDELDADAA